MPTLHFMHRLEGQPDQEVGCEMFEESESILNERGKLCYCVKENGLFKVYKAPLVDTTDLRASKLRVMKGSQEYAVSKGDYVEGTWTEVVDVRSHTRRLAFTPPALLKRNPPDASGKNLKYHFEGCGHWVTIYIVTASGGKETLTEVHLSQSSWQSRTDLSGSLYVRPLTLGEELYYDIDRNNLFASEPRLRIEVLQ